MQMLIGPLTKFNLLYDRNGGFVSPFLPYKLAWSNMSMRVKELFQKKQEPVENNISALAFQPNLVLIGMNTPVSSIILITKDNFKIGYDDDCDATLSFSKEISRHHACITWTEGKYTITDTNSSNGTYLNGKCLNPNVPYFLTNGDRVQFSSFSFEVKEMQF